MLCLTFSWSLRDLLESKREQGRFSAIASPGGGMGRAVAVRRRPHEAAARRAASRRGGTHENLPSFHRGRPESLYRHRVLPEGLGDTESGWNHGLSPGGNRRAGRMV